MKKIIMSNYVTIEGFFAGPNGDIGWVVWDEDTAQYSNDRDRHLWELVWDPQWLLLD